MSCVLLIIKLGSLDWEWKTSEQGFFSSAHMGTWYQQDIWLLMVSLTTWLRQQHSIGFFSLSHFLPLFTVYCFIHIVVTKYRIGKPVGGTAYLGSQFQWIQSITWARQGSSLVGTFGLWCSVTVTLVTVLIVSGLCSCSHP